MSFKCALSLAVHCCSLTVNLSMIFRSSPRTLAAVSCLFNVGFHLFSGVKGMCMYLLFNVSQQTLAWSHDISPNREKMWLGNNLYYIAMSCCFRQCKLQPCLVEIIFSPVVSDATQLSVFPRSILRMTAHHRRLYL